MCPAFVVQQCPQPPGRFSGVLDEFLGGATLGVRRRPLRAGGFDPVEEYPDLLQDHPGIEQCVGPGCLGEPFSS
ncbi:hypothetical protein OG292_07780 [Streptomyces sp. NBC_01511]|uniref:hypothetical protein n=1 Tax=Streptomyces sp. NBC_01511 TaxID=2903889 RepID=UPI003870C657